MIKALVLKQLLILPLRQGLIVTAESHQLLIRKECMSYRSTLWANQRFKSTHPSALESDKHGKDAEQDRRTTPKKLPHLQTSQSQRQQEPLEEEPERKRKEDQGQSGNQDTGQKKKEQDGPGNKQESSQEKDDTYSSRSTMSRALIPSSLFESQQDKTKSSFLIAIEMFIHNDKQRRGHVEFIYSAMKNMKAFGVHRDLETYKQIFSVFPQGKFIPTNIFQVEFQHFPKQQNCAINLLDQMEEFGVMPDGEFQGLIMNTFGRRTHVMRKFMRMLYWMPKFKNLSPWPLPEPMPENSLELAKLAIQRITSVDLTTKITCFNANDLDDSVDDTWIVSGQSEAQRKLIADLPADRPVYVEGAFRVWLTRCCINYFILRAEPKERPKVEKDPDDVGFIRSLFQEDYTETQVATVPTVHEQEDGVILACCATGSSSRDSLISWIKFLEDSNPRLGKDISVLFTLKSPLGPTDDLELIQIESGKPETKTEYLEISQSKQNVKRIYSQHGNLDEFEFNFDPSAPRLSQMGLGEHSDSRFVNWPHHYNKDTIEQLERVKASPPVSFSRSRKENAQFLNEEEITSESTKKTDS